MDMHFLNAFLCTTLGLLFLGVAILTYKEKMLGLTIGTSVLALYFFGLVFH